MLDKVMLALTNPSAEFMDVYIQLGLAVALVLGAIFMMMPSKKENLILTMDDDGATGGAEKAVSKRARARVRPAGQG